MTTTNQVRIATATTTTWTKPKLVRLGQIADVAGGQPTPIQNANNS